MVWQKGQSGNPSGRKANPKIRRTVTELAREIAPKAIRTLEKIMDDTKSTSTARAIAAAHILDRAYGKAPQAIAVVAAPNRPISDYTDAELAEIIASGTEPERDRETKLIEGTAVELDPSKPD